MVQQLEVPIAVDDPAGVRTARRATVEVIAQWKLRPSVAHDACQVVSELVTNALLHGRSDAALRLVHEDDCLRVEVSDQNSRLPVLMAPDTASLSGRGLAIVASLATLWGTDRTDDGKVVWAEFDLSERRHH